MCSFSTQKQKLICFLPAVLFVLQTHKWRGSGPFDLITTPQDTLEDTSFTATSMGFTNVPSLSYLQLKDSQKNCWSQQQSPASFSKSSFIFFTRSRASFKSIVSSGISENSFKNWCARAAPLDMSLGSLILFLLDPTCKQLTGSQGAFHG